MRIVIAITGASGSLYAQRLLDNLDARAHEVHVVLSNYAHAVLAEELPDGLRLPAGVVQHGLKSMNVPFASGFLGFADFFGVFAGFVAFPIRSATYFA